MKKLNITNFEALNIVAFYNQLTKEKIAVLPQLVQWRLASAVKKLTPTVKEFEEFRDEKLREIREEYFGEEKSEEYMIDKVDNDGNPMLNEDGNQITEPGRKVKAEYEYEYQTKIDELNKGLQIILSETNPYEFSTVNMDDVVENLPQPNDWTTDELMMLDAIIGEA